MILDLDLLLYFPSFKYMVKSSLFSDATGPIVVVQLVCTISTLAIQERIIKS